LGSALAAVKGYGHDETRAAYERAHELAASLPAAAELFPVLFGIVAYSTARGDFPAARVAADRLLRSADAASDSGLRIEALFSMGILDVYTGRAAEAVASFEEAIALYDPDLHHALAFSYVFDPGVACLRSIGIPLTALGDREGARRRADEAIELGERLAHPFSHASALVFSAILAALHGDHVRAARDAGAAVELAERGGYAFWALSGRVLRGWASAEHLDDARQALAAYQATGTKVFVPLWLRLLADALARAGDTKAAEGLADDARVAAAETGEVCWEGFA
jgi:predicted ATPase